MHSKKKHQNDKGVPLERGTEDSSGRKGNERQRGGKKGKRIAKTINSDEEGCPRSVKEKGGC